MGLATREPVILVVALALFAAELPLAVLTERRHLSSRAQRRSIGAAVPEA